MAELLKQLENDALPQNVVVAFTNWCIWEQALPALATVVEHAGIDNAENHLRAADDIIVLAEITEQIRDYVSVNRDQISPLAYSSTEAALFEFLNLLSDAGDAGEPASVAFFAARVCGWAGWVQTRFQDATQKIAAEEQARADQENKLSQLMK
jgi:hypothetical protein